MEYGNSGFHAVAVALWQSGGASTTVVGGLPLPVRATIFGLFLKCVVCFVLSLATIG